MLGLHDASMVVATVVCLSQGLAPVHVAARMGRVEVITQLVQRGAKIDMLSSGALASVIAAKVSSISTCCFFQQQDGARGLAKPTVMHTSIPCDVQDHLCMDIHMCVKMCVRVRVCAWACTEWSA